MELVPAWLSALPFLKTPATSSWLKVWKPVVERMPKIRDVDGVNRLRAQEAAQKTVQQNDRVQEGRWIEKLCFRRICGTINELAWQQCWSFEVRSRSWVVESLCQQSNRAGKVHGPPASNLTRLTSPQSIHLNQHHSIEVLGASLDFSTMYIQTHQQKVLYVESINCCLLPRWFC